MYNQMVMHGDQLDRVFAALADPTRRGMLERLADGETNVGTLAEPYDISQPAASKHLRVLERAGLIQRKRIGREHRIRIDPRPIEEAQTCRRDREEACTECLTPRGASSRPP